MVNPLSITYVIMKLDKTMYIYTRWFSLRRMHNTIDIIIDIVSLQFLKADKGAKLTLSKTEEQVCNNYY